jgi:DNA-binding IclR family transcriptional regulator
MSSGILTLSGYQIALAALLPKRGTGATEEQLVQASKLPQPIVRAELRQMVDAGLLTFDAASGEYRNAGDAHAES